MANSESATDSAENAVESIASGITSNADSDDVGGTSADGGMSSAHKLPIGNTPHVTLTAEDVVGEAQQSGVIDVDVAQDCEGRETGEQDASFDTSASDQGISLEGGLVEVDSADDIGRPFAVQDVGERSPERPSDEHSSSDKAKTLVASTNSSGDAHITVDIGVILEDEQELSANLDENGDMAGGDAVVGQGVPVRGAPASSCEISVEPASPLGERNDSQLTASFSEDREPTLSFVEEQSGDRFDMDSFLPSSLSSAGMATSGAALGSRMHGRTLSGGLLGSQARRPFSRQSSGNLLSLEVQDIWKGDNGNTRTGAVRMEM